MNLTERAAKLLQEIDAKLALVETGEQVFLKWCGNSYEWGALTDVEQQRWNRFTTSRTLLPASLRCLKTAIEEFVKQAECGQQCGINALTAICYQWESGR